MRPIPLPAVGQTPVALRAPSVRPATSLATIFGALPIALALGAGAQSRVPLGIVVVGGLLFALVLTLFVIPATYVRLADPRLHEAPPVPGGAP